MSDIVQPPSAPVASPGRVPRRPWTAPNLHTIADLYLVGLTLSFVVMWTLMPDFYRPEAAKSWAATNTIWLIPVAAVLVVTIGMGFIKVGGRLGLFNRWWTSLLMIVLFLGALVYVVKTHGDLSAKALVRSHNEAKIAHKSLVLQAPLPAQIPGLTDAERDRAESTRQQYTKAVEKSAQKKEEEHPEQNTPKAVREEAKRIRIEESDKPGSAGTTGGGTPPTVVPPPTTNDAAEAPYVDLPPRPDPNKAGDDEFAKFAGIAAFGACTAYGGEPTTCGIIANVVQSIFGSSGSTTEEDQKRITSIIAKIAADPTGAQGLDLTGIDFQNPDDAIAKLRTALAALKQKGALTADQAQQLNAVIGRLHDQIARVSRCAAEVQAAYISSNGDKCRAFRVATTSASCRFEGGGADALEKAERSVSDPTLRGILHSVRLAGETCE